MNFIRVALRRALLMLTWRPVSMRRSKRSFQNLKSPRPDGLRRVVSSPLLLPASPPPSPANEGCWFVDDQEDEYVFVRDEYEDDEQEVPLGVTALSAAAAACTCFFGTKNWYDHSASLASRMLCLISIICLSLSAAAIIVLSGSALAFEEGEQVDEYCDVAGGQQRATVEEHDESGGGKREGDDDEMQTALDLVEACRRAAPDSSNAVPESHGGPLAHVLSFDLEMKAADTFEKYWADYADGGTFYTTFLQEHVKNKNAVATGWEEVAKGARHRKVETLHPLATSIRVPGLALVIPTVKRQIAFENDENDEVALAIFERSRFKDIPYAGALRVETVWLFYKDTTVHVYFRCVFLTKVLKVPSWIQRLASHNTKTELNTTYSKWRDAVRDDLLDHQPTTTTRTDAAGEQQQDQQPRRNLRQSSSTSERGRNSAQAPPPFSLDGRNATYSSSDQQHVRSLDDIFCFRKQHQRMTDEDDESYDNFRSSFLTSERGGGLQQHRKTSFYQQRTSRLLASCAEDDEELHRHLKSSGGVPNARYVSAPHETTSDRNSTRRRHHRASAVRSAYEVRAQPPKLSRGTTDSAVDYTY